MRNGCGTFDPAWWSLVDDDLSFVSCTFSNPPIMYHVMVLDPIDGTQSFITGKPLFGTLILLLHNGTPVIRIIDQCVLNERWLGIVGKESTLNGTPIKTDGVLTFSDAEMYSTTPDMFQAGKALTKFDPMRGAVRTPHY